MQINYCLILAAGLGTRMGAIGKKLPKVLWPVFEKSLLELQVGYAKSLGVDKIFINLHFMSKEIELFCKSRPIFSDVIFLNEQPDILDIGGAIHNVATQVKYQGRLLVLNSDQFFYIKKEDLTNILEPYSEYPAVLFSYWVNSSLGYNALEMDSNRFVKEIIKNKDLPSQSRVETYTGISVIDFKKLKPVTGKSAFFDSVCPYSQFKVPAILLDRVDYWDFGTIKRYWETSHRILTTYSTNSNHPFIRFLVQERALKTWKINLVKHSYHAKSPGVINLTPDIIEGDINPCILLDGLPHREAKPAIWWNDISEEVN